MKNSKAVHDIVMVRRVLKALFPDTDIPNFKRISRRGSEIFCCRTPSGKNLILMLTGKDDRTVLCKSVEFDVPHNTREFYVPCGKPVREVASTNVSP